MLKPIFCLVFLVINIATLKPLVADDYLSDDLLAEDDFEFEGQGEEQTKNWWDDLRFVAQQSYAQGRKVNVLRSEARLEYESALWENGYVKLDDRLTYFFYEDTFGQQAGSDYGNHKLHEAWAQHSNSFCSAKLGRQNLLWGAVEGTFAVDVLSPFDYTEPLLTDFATIRRTQDLILLECFPGDSHWQVFFQPRASLDVIQHRHAELYENLEDSLNEEWGMRYQHSVESLDISFMYARLYDNTPTPVIDLLLPSGLALDVSRFDFFGMSTVWAVGRLLLELDAGYKKDQLVSFTGEREDQFELALGFEYTTSSNHQFNAGIWSFVMSPSTEEQRVESLTFGWNKNYLNDDLTMSLLGAWIDEIKQSSLAVQAAYKVDDFWQVNGALTYTEAGESEVNQPESNVSRDSGWATTLIIKWQY